jgi:hypothetical protein
MVTESRHIGGAHPDAAVTGRASQEILLRCSMNVDATLKSILIACFLPLEPENAGYYRIASRGVRLENLSGRCAGFEDLAKRLAHTDLGFHRQLSKRGGVAPQAITDAVSRGGNRVDPRRLSIGHQKKLLILHTHNDLVMGVACHRSSNRNRGNRRSSRSPDLIGSREQSGRK